MTGTSAALEAQVAALRDDIAAVTAHARRAATRIEELEQALQLVRDLMRDLPAHDNVALVAVRLRRHFDNLAGAVIDDALAVPLQDVRPPTETQDP